MPTASRPACAPPGRSPRRATGAGRSPSWNRCSPAIPTTRRRIISSAPIATAWASTTRPSRPAGRPCGCRPRTMSPIACSVSFCRAAGAAMARRRSMATRRSASRRRRRGTTSPWANSRSPCRSRAPPWRHSRRRSLWRRTMPRFLPSAPSAASSWGETKRPLPMPAGPIAPIPATSGRSPPRRVRR